jgi:photoactive yellow protein
MTMETAAAPALIRSDAPNLLDVLEGATPEVLDGLPFGVIGLDPNGLVERYNATEARAAGLLPARVIGRPFFSAVAPCMNNALFAGRFAGDADVDAVVDYAFTLHMVLRRVRVRLLKRAGVRRAYLVVEPRNWSMDAAPGTGGSPAATQADLLEFLYLTPIGILKFRPDGQVQMANPMAAQLLSPLAVNVEQWNVYGLFASLAPDLQARVERYQPETGLICDKLQVVVPGHDKPMVLSLGINKIGPDVLMAIVQDVTSAVEQEQRIFEERQRLRAIFDNVRDYAIFTADHAGCVDDWNRSMQRLGGWEAADVMGRHVSMFFVPGENSHVRSVELLDRARQCGTTEFEGWDVRKDGRAFWGNTVVTALPDREGRRGGFVLVTRDLTERKEMEDRLSELATVDSLTGALNRRAGESQVNDAWRRWGRYANVFALLMVDCDHFKAVNDQFGHGGGDEVLRALVRTCHDLTRDVDSMIRWGGEEFLVVLPETGTEGARVVAERLRRSVETTPIVWQGRNIELTVSIGITTASHDDTKGDDVIDRADRALYIAKTSGRNRVVVA